MRSSQARLALRLGCSRQPRLATDLGGLMAGCPSRPMRHVGAGGDLVHASGRHDLAPGPGGAGWWTRWTGRAKRSGGDGTRGGRREDWPAFPGEPERPTGGNDTRRKYIRCRGDRLPHRADRAVPASSELGEFPRPDAGLPKFGRYGTDGFDHHGSQPDGASSYWPRRSCTCCVGTAP